jgi:hypothetical protein
MGLGVGVSHVGELGRWVMEKEGGVKGVESEGVVFNKQE